MSRTNELERSQKPQNLRLPIPKSPQRTALKSPSIRRFSSMKYPIPKKKFKLIQDQKSFFWSLKLLRRSQRTQAKPLNTNRFRIVSKRNCKMGKKFSLKSFRLGTRVPKAPLKRNGVVTMKNLSSLCFYSPLDGSNRRTRVVKRCVTEVAKGKITSPLSPPISIEKLDSCSSDEDSSDSSDDDEQSKKYFSLKNYCDIMDANVVNLKDK